ncbi:zinc ribbon domain-containing protein, partial [Staphylococcus aureus]|uniref:zinc ribbon domain-containing protein n=1 Tax=Staphylococcus aureus TaxID=1280 RepID=UPI0039A63462
DWLSKVTWSLVSEYDSIHIEDLNVSGMTHNHRLAKHIVDSLFGEFRRQLTYKCEWYGKQLVLVNRWYPSSQLCSNCGYRNHNT